MILVGAKLIGRRPLVVDGCRRFGTDACEAAPGWLVGNLRSRVILNLDEKITCEAAPGWLVGNLRSRVILNLDEKITCNL